MEAATAAPTKKDHELALKLGSLLKHLLNPAGDATFRVIDESGLTFIQTKALLSIAITEDEHLSVNALAGQLNISLPSASRVVDELVRGKLVSRIEDPDDRRVRQISLTGSGTRLADDLITARLEGLERFAASLSAAERSALTTALDVLLEREEIAEAYRSGVRRGGTR